MVHWDIQINASSLVFSGENPHQTDLILAIPKNKMILTFMKAYRWTSTLKIPSRFKYAIVAVGDGALELEADIRP